MVSITGGGLSFEASINSDQLESSLARIENQLNGVADAANKQSASVQNFSLKSASGLTQLSQTVETLRAKILARGEFILTEKDVTKIAAYNREIEVLKVQLAQILNAGKKGFDDQGNAIKNQLGLFERLQRQTTIYKEGLRTATLPENIIKYNRKLEETNLQISKLGNAGKKGFDELGNATKRVTGLAGGLQKGFSFFRQAAFLIPGLGIAGIFNLIGEGVSALIGHLFKSTGALSLFKQNLKNINDVVKEGNKEAGKQISDLKLLYTAATNVNLTMKERLAAVNALQNEFPDYFAKIKDETILNGKAKDSYDQLSSSIIAASRATAAKAKIDEIEAQKLDIAFQKKKIEDTVAGEKSRAKNQEFTVTGGQGPATSGVITKQKQQEIIEQRRIKAIREQEKIELSLDQQEKFLIQFVGEKNITKLVVDENTKRSKVKDNSKQIENEINALLEKRKLILQGIDDLERDAFQSGLTRELSEIDKINERREKELGILKGLNKVIDEYNKKHKTKLQGVGDNEFSRVNSASNLLIANATAKRDADIYIEGINKKQKAYDDFQQALKTGNTLIIENAREANKEQLGDFDNFIDLLTSEYDKLFNSLEFDGSDNIGIVSRFDQIKKLLDAAILDSIRKQSEAQNEQFLKLLDMSATYGQRKFQINKKYDDLEATLREKASKFSKEEVEERSALLKKARQSDLDNLNDDVAKGLPEFEKFFKGIENLSDKSARIVIRDAKKLLAELLKAGKISADLAEEIGRGLSEATNSLDSRFPERLNKVSNLLGSMSGSVRQFNEELANSLQMLSDMVGSVAGVQKGIADFKKAKENDDTTGQIAAGADIAAIAINTISNIIAGFKAAKKSKEDAKKSILEFQQAILAGELQYNEVIRQRQRDEVKLQKLKIKGYQDERKLLEDQKKAVLVTYNELFAKLQNESFVSSTGSKKKAGSLLGGIIGLISGTRTVVTQQLASLSGKSFEEMEKLFLSGQLSDSAKKIFEQLQAIKKEGIDIDQLLADNAQAIREAFTGTTADSIVQSITDGFAQGKRSAADFAGTFQELMQKALLQSLQLKYLEGPLTDFFNEFAAFSESDGQLTQGEVSNLQSIYNDILSNAATQFDQLQQVAGINLSSQGSQSNSLSGAIKGISESQADLLASQFGGLRITALDHLTVARSQLNALNAIQGNTGTHVVMMAEYMRRIEFYYGVQGVKVI